MPVKPSDASRSEEHTSELQSRVDLVCRLLLEKKKGRRLPDDHADRRRIRAVLPVVEHPGHRRGRRPRAGAGVRADQHFFFFFNDTPTTEIYTLSLHDALPI